MPAVFCKLKTPCLKFLALSPSFSIEDRLCGTTGNAGSLGNGVDAVGYTSIKDLRRDVLRREEAEGEQGEGAGGDLVP